MTHDLRSPKEQGSDAFHAGRPVADNPYVGNGLGRWARERQEGWEEAETGLVGGEE